MYEKIAEKIGKPVDLVKKEIEELAKTHGISFEAAAILYADEHGVSLEGENEKAYWIKDIEKKEVNLVVKVASNPRVYEVKDGAQVTVVYVTDGTGVIKVSAFNNRGNLQGLKRGDIIKIIDPLVHEYEGTYSLRVTKFTRIIRDPKEDERYEQVKEVKLASRAPKINIVEAEDYRVFEVDAVVVNEKYYGKVVDGQPKLVSILALDDGTDTQRVKVFSNTLEKVVNLEEVFNKMRELNDYEQIKEYLSNLQLLTGRRVKVRARWAEDRFYGRIFTASDIAEVTKEDIMKNIEALKKEVIE